MSAQPASGPSLPGRERPTRPEAAWPSGLAVLVAIGLQLVLPSRVTVGPIWLLPALEALLLVGLAAATPMQLEAHHPRRRAASLALIALVSLANIVSLALVTHRLLHHGVSNGSQLIVAGTLIWLTNVVIFGLWYWQTDRGGPGKRAEAADIAPDFLFPQMTQGDISRPDWRPQFLDYLYVSLTNATAFSPTDTMPLTQQAKSLMGLQALVSLVTIGLVVSRAVNILG